MDGGTDRLREVHRLPGLVRGGRPSCYVCKMTTPSAEIAAKLVGALLQAEGTLVLQWQPGVAQLQNGDGRVLVLWSANPITQADLRQQLATIVKAHKIGLLQVVIVGEAENAIKEMKRAAPTYQFGETFTFVLLRDLTDAQRAAGKISSSLKAALKNAPTTAPVDEQSVVPRLAVAQQAFAEHTELATALDARFPWASLSIGVVCMALFVMAKIWERDNFSMALAKMGANHGGLVRDGEYWRVLSSAFLHGSVQHVFFNMLALASFGPFLEKLLGVRRFLVLYGLAALGGGLASAFLHSSPTLSVGASGAIWGLMAAGVVLALRPRGLLPSMVIQQARKRALLPLVLNAAYSFAPGIDLHAHFGGGLVGAALVFTGIVTAGVMPLWSTDDGGPRTAETPSRGWSIAAGIAALAMAGSIVTALLHDKVWQGQAQPAFVQVAVGDTGLSFEMPYPPGPPITETKQGMQLFTFGRLDAHPIAVEVVHHLLDATVQPAEMAEIMAAEIDGLNKSPLPNSQLLAPAQLVTIGGRQAAFVIAQLKTVTVHTWISIHGDREVALRVYAVSGINPAWTAAIDRIAASLSASNKTTTP